MFLLNQFKVGESVEIESGEICLPKQIISAPVGDVYIAIGIVFPSPDIQFGATINLIQGACNIIRTDVNQ